MTHGTLINTVYKTQLETVKDKKLGILDKNGIVLKQVVNICTMSVESYELYMNGSFVHRYHDFKLAKNMWKDFSA